MLNVTNFPLISSATQLGHSRTYYTKLYIAHYSTCRTYAETLSFINILRRRCIYRAAYCERTCRDTFFIVTIPLNTGLRFYVGKIRFYASQAIQFIIIIFIFGIYASLRPNNHADLNVKFVDCAFKRFVSKMCHRNRWNILFLSYAASIKCLRRRRRVPTHTHTKFTRGESLYNFNIFSWPLVWPCTNL